MPTIAPESLNALVPTKEAARLAGVSVAAISNWKERGWLKPATWDEKGRPLYRFLDVARAEYATRQKARRHLNQAS